MRHLIVGFSFCLLVLASSRPASADLIWHSALDGDATALVGADGIAGGSPTATADLNGNPDGAMLFNGTSDYFNIGYLGTFSAGSISAWVRSDNNGSERGAVAAGRTGGGTDVYFSFMNENGGRIRVDLDDGALRRDVLSNDVMVVGQWYHVATTWTADGTLRLYMDGVLQTDLQDLAGDADPYVMTGNGVVGSELLGTGRYWQGAIDDVRIYDHELSAGDVTSLFNAGPQYLVPEPSSAVLAILGLMLGTMLWRRHRR